MEYFGTDFNNHGHYRWYIGNNELEMGRSDFRDLPFHPEYLTKNLKKGDFAYYQGGGFTCIAISGSVVDERSGTESVFWVKDETLSKEDMLKLIIDNPIANKIINNIKK